MKSEWKTFENIHLDMNPWGYVANGKKVLRLLDHIDSYCCNLSSAFQSVENRTRNTDKLKSLTYSRRSDFVTENNEVDNDEVSVQALVNFADNIERDGILSTFNIQSSQHMNRRISIDSKLQTRLGEVVRTELTASVSL